MNYYRHGDILLKPLKKLPKQLKKISEDSQFVLKALEIIPEGRKVAMLLKIQFLVGMGCLFNVMGYAYEFLKEKERNKHAENN